MDFVSVNRRYAPLPTYEEETMSSCSCLSDSRPWRSARPIRCGVKATALAGSPSRRQKKERGALLRPCPARGTSQDAEVPGSDAFDVWVFVGPSSAGTAAYCRLRTQVASDLKLPVTALGRWFAPADRLLLSQLLTMRWTHSAGICILPFAQRTALVSVQSST